MDRFKTAHARIATNYMGNSFKGAIPETVYAKAAFGGMTS